MNTNTLYLNYIESSYRTNNDIDYNERINITEFKNFYRKSSPKFFEHSFEVPDEIYNSNGAYLSVIRYTDGNTFGKTKGLVHFVGVSKTREGAKRNLEREHELTHRPWDGYFSRWEDDQIFFLEITDH